MMDNTRWINYIITGEHIIYIYTYYYIIQYLSSTVLIYDNYHMYLYMLSRHFKMVNMTKSYINSDIISMKRSVKEILPSYVN